MWTKENNSEGNGRVPVEMGRTLVRVQTLIREGDKDEYRRRNKSPKDQSGYWKTHKE